MKTTSSGTGSRAATTRPRQPTDRCSTPFADEHGAALRLRSGLPPPLDLLSAALGALLVAVGAVIAPTRWDLRCALIVAGCVAALLYLREGRKRGPPAELRVTRSGQVHYRECGGRTWSGGLGTVHWHSRQVAVLSIRLSWGAVSCLVLRYRQRPGEYRRLRVWLRHGLPEGDDGRPARGP